jgi:hypothetical protein
MANDFAALIAQAGGALSAQATGGSQGLQSFLNRLAQQQAQQSQQEFERESRLRDQMFQMARDRKQRAHEAGMQARRLAAQQAERSTAEEKARDLTAGGLYIQAMSNPNNRFALEGAIRAGGGILPDEFDWSNREAVMPFISAAVERGLQPRTVVEVGEQRASAETWYQENLGDSSLLPTAGDWQTQLVKDKQQLTTAQNRLTNIGGQAAALEAQLQALAQETPNLTGDQYLERLRAISRSYAEVAQGRAGLETGNFGRFFGENTKLRSTYDLIGTQLGNIANQLESQPEVKSNDLLAAWDISRPESFPGLIEGFGGGDDQDGTNLELENFEKLLAGQGFRAKSEQFSQLVAYLQTVTPETAQYLDNETRRVWNLVHQRAGNGDPLDLSTLLTDMRSAQIAGNNEEYNDNSRFIANVAKIDPTGSSIAVNRGVSRAQQISAAKSLNSSLSRTGQFGFRLFDNDEQLAQAIDTYGQVQQDGTRTVDEGFLARYVESDAGLSNIVDRGIANLTASDDMSKQLEMRLMGTLERLQLKTPDLRNRLRRQIAARTGEIATLTPDLGPEEIHGYSGTQADAFIGLARNPSSSPLALLPAQDRNAEVDRFTSTVFSEQADPEGYKRLRDRARQTMLAESPSYQQPIGIGHPFSLNEKKVWGTMTTRGPEKALRLRAEAASEQGGNVTAGDVIRLFQSSVPEYAQLLASPGRVYGQSVMSLPKWARDGEALVYTNGGEAFARQYADSGIDVDANTLNILGFIDSARALPLHKLASSIGGDVNQMRLLRTMQETLRDMTYEDAIAAFAGPNPEGLPFERLTPAESIPTVEDTQTLTTLVGTGFNVAEERAKIAAARRTLSDREVGEFVETDSGYAIFDEALLAAETADLDKREADLTSIDNAEFVQAVTNRAPRLMADLFLQNSITNPADLAVALAETQPIITGMSVDQLGLETATFNAYVGELSQEGVTEAQALSTLIELMSFSSSQRTKAEGVAISATTPMKDRPFVLQAGNLMLNTYREEISAIAESLARREVSLGRSMTSADFPPDLASTLDRAGFDDMEARSGTALDLFRAAKVWAAHRNVNF